ncbi:MAG: hypothetical protein GY737_02155 [Desulfobacteraceae bacterium]|nr:hypothetical protein [Desulfobacteraceae bacterium]
MLCPALAGLFLAAGAKELGLIEPWVLPPALQTLFFVVAALTSVAAPLMVRTLFAHSLRESSGADPQSFLVFQQRLLLVALLTPWLAILVMVFDFRNFYGSSMVLMALYAAYYYYPSERRIDFDSRIFRVEGYEKNI